MRRDTRHLLEKHPLPWRAEHFNGDASDILDAAGRYVVVDVEPAFADLVVSLVHRLDDVIGLLRCARHIYVDAPPTEVADYLRRTESAESLLSAILRGSGIR